MSRRRNNTKRKNNSISFTKTDSLKTTAQARSKKTPFAVTARRGTVMPNNNKSTGRNRNWTAYNGTTPAIAGTSSAWYKSVLDPAHAREYGCVGIPDENKDPSVVVCRRRDGTISPGWFVGQRCLAYLPADATISSPAQVITYAWVVSSIEGATSITRVNLRQYPQGGVVIEAFGEFDVVSARTTSEINVSIDGTSFTGAALYWKAKVDRVILVTEDAFEAAEQSYEAMNGSTNFSNNVKSATNVTQGRIISSSMTASNVTAMTNRGGYFTAGHCPQQLPHPSQSDLDRAGVDESEVSYLDFAPNLDSYATYSGGPDAGVYVISRPRNVHNMLIWETSDDNVTFSIPPSVLPPLEKLFLMVAPNVGGSPRQYATVNRASIVKYNFIVVPNHDATSISPSFSKDCTWNYLHQTVVSWDVNWFSWFPNTDAWTLRVTRFYNYEKKLSYDEGGTDGARADRNSINLLMAALDHTELVFDHTVNDGKKVRAVIKRVYDKYGKEIMAAAGALGAPKFARKAADLLLRGWLN